MQYENFEIKKFKKFCLKKILKLKLSRITAPLGEIFFSDIL